MFPSSYQFPQSGHCAISVCDPTPAPGVLSTLRGFSFPLGADAFPDAAFWLIFLDAAGEIKKSGDAYVSQKPGHPGLGIASIARSYDGGIGFTHKGHMFHASVMLKPEKDMNAGI